MRLGTRLGTRVTGRGKGGGGREDGGAEDVDGVDGAVLAAAGLREELPRRGLTLRTG